LGGWRVNEIAQGRIDGKSDRDSDLSGMRFSCPGGVGDIQRVLDGNPCGKENYFNQGLREV